VGYVVDFEIVGIVAADYEHVGDACHVAELVNVRRVGDLEVVDKEGVAVQLGCEGCGGGVFPHAVFMHEVGNARAVKLAERGLYLLCGQEVACHLHLVGLRSLEAERYGVVGVYFG